MRKYKIGDRVIIKSFKEIKKIRDELGFGLDPIRKKFCGKIVTIEDNNFSYNKYFIVGDSNYYWYDYMIKGPAGNKYKKLKEAL